MRASLLIALPLFALSALPAVPAAAKMVPPAQVTNAAADEAVARSAWNSRLTVYQDCAATERVVRSHQIDATLKVPSASRCAYPGPYVSPSMAAVQKYNEATLAQTAKQDALSDNVKIAQTAR